LSHASPFFLLAVFEIESCFMSGSVWTAILLLTSHIARKTGLFHHTQANGEHFARASLKPWSSQIHFLITGLTHGTWLNFSSGKIHTIWTFLQIVIHYA
jgi:hypothetical protein